MKKLALVIIAAAFIVSCQSCKPKLAPHAPTVVEMSLNGISWSSADTMITNFINNPDSKPNNTQIFFTKQYLDDVLSVLKSDSLHGAVKPDGIRVYFSRLPVTPATPLHSNNGIIIVSTYFAGITMMGKDSGFIHRDYYEHDANAGLFKLADIGGITTHDTSAINGALLYNTCNCDAKFASTVVSPAHDIKRSVAENMAKAFYGEPFNSLSEWFDIAMLRDIDKAAGANGGIRIYFTRAPATQLATNSNLHVDLLVSAETSLVFVLTHQVARTRTLSIQLDSIPDDNGGKCKPADCIPPVIIQAHPGTEQ